VEITTASGEREVFDEVVMATDAESALAVLSDATAEERMLLGAFHYDPVSVAVHTDPVVMPPNRRDWAAYTYVTDRVSGPFEDAIRSYCVPMIQRWVDFDLFVSFDVPDGHLDPQKVITEFRWKHLMMDLEQILATAELHRIQGKRKTWFCGEYTSVAFGHEFSFTSGLAVAKALGADYPFEDSRLARLAFYDHACHHMKLVPPIQRGVGTGYNSLIDNGKCATDSLKRRLQREIRAEIERRLPKTIGAVIFALPGVEKLLVDAVARRLSPFEAYKKMQSEREV
jgi:hypothetical protein